MLVDFGRPLPQPRWTHTRYRRWHYNRCDISHCHTVLHGSWPQRRLLDRLDSGFLFSPDNFFFFFFLIPARQASTILSTTPAVLSPKVFFGTSWAISASCVLLRCSINTYLISSFAAINEKCPSGARVSNSRPTYILKSRIDAEFTAWSAGEARSTAVRKLLNWYFEAYFQTEDKNKDVELHHLRNWKRK